LGATENATPPAFSEGLLFHSTSAQLLAAAGIEGVFRRRTNQRRWHEILLTLHGGSSATCLGTLDTSIANRWVFDESRRVLWVGLDSGGPFRIALIE
jgi:hypothetical protein